MNKELQERKLNQRKFVIHLENNFLSMLKVCDTNKRFFCFLMLQCSEGQKASDRACDK